MLACELSTSMLWARVVRGAASRAKLVSPAPARRCRPSRSKGLRCRQAQRRVAFARVRPTSGDRTFKTNSQPRAPAWSVISAPAARNASSVALATKPAPEATRTVWPCGLSFLAVSGVTATRVSPAMVSAGTPISMASPRSHRPRDRTIAPRRLPASNPPPRSQWLVTRHRATGPSGRAPLVAKTTGRERVHRGRV